MRYRDVGAQDPAIEAASRAVAQMPATPGLEDLKVYMGVEPEKAPVGPLSTEQPLPGKTVARGRRTPAKAKPAKKRGRRS